MILRWGMSDKIGNIDYAEAHDGYMGSTGGFSVSAKTKELIEGEVKSLIADGYAIARKILLEKHVEFERLAKGLLEYETLTGDEIRKVVAGEMLGTDAEGGDQPGGGAQVSSIVPKTRKPKAPKPGMEPEPSA